MIKLRTTPIADFHWNPQRAVSARSSSTQAFENWLLSLQVTDPGKYMVIRKEIETTAQSEQINTDTTDLTIIRLALDGKSVYILHGMVPIGTTLRGRPMFQYNFVTCMEAEAEQIKRQVFKMHKRR